MRVLLATVLLVSSSLCPLLAEEAAKAPPAASQTVPAPPDRNPAQPRDQPAERDRAGDDREFNRDGRVRRGEGGSMGQADREMGFARKMQRDRDDYRDGDPAQWPANTSASRTKFQFRATALIFRQLQQMELVPASGV